MQSVPTTGANESLCAPIALFVFNRPVHTLKTLRALAANPEFSQSPLYIFCDGPRSAADREAVEATRQVVGDWEHSNKVIVAQAENRGLANSVVAGVTELCSRHGVVIVVEDDLVVRPTFLQFLNGALERYGNSERVMQVSAFMFSVEDLPADDDAFFLPFITSWGWATWARAWSAFDAQASGWQSLLSDRALRKEFDLDGNYGYSHMLMMQMTGRIDSWAIRWNWSVYRRRGLVLYPPRSFVLNIGLDGTGTHGRARPRLETADPDGGQVPSFPTRVIVDEQKFTLVKNAVRLMSGGVLLRAYKHLKGILFRRRLVFSNRRWS